MEAVPRLPMISFELKTSTENPPFGPALKEYIASFYNEDPNSYNTEIHKLDCLRNAAAHPSTDVGGVQILKKYYCQLNFLKSRFPMEEGQQVQIYFPWKDPYSNMFCNVPNIQFELMSIIYNIGALHSQLGAVDSRNNPEGMKMACTHFQCAAWAFQMVRENYTQMVLLVLAPEVIHYMQQVCLAQAQECILEKSMMDNRKATIIAKVAVQVVDYYKQALQTLQSGGDEGSFSELLGFRICKDWNKYLSFKIAYHKCIALLFQGQQAEEQQKMGERVAFYQAASDQLEEARKLSSNLQHQQEISEALAFTLDVVEGKKKAAKNENEFIYHEDVPEKDALQEVKGASLVKGIPFNINDIEVSDTDIFARLVPMEAHEASSMYSEQKAQMLRQLGELVESKDQALAEFMSSLKLDFLIQIKQASGLSQDLVDRAAALSARPTATQDLVNAMSKLSDSYHEVEAMLNEIQELLKDEEQNEKEYQTIMGKRPPSIIATDLAREAAKYREAHNKASESNQNLHKAMTSHIANLKILAQPLAQLKQQIPSIELPNANVDAQALHELENLRNKVDEMKNQRTSLWNQLREAVHQDDITSVLVTRQPDQSLDQIFQQELQKHKKLGALIEQNVLAQDNITKALIESYAHITETRRYIQELMNQRSSTISALITSYDTYDDLLGKANKGIEFYSKLETNVSKLLQRIKSACKVQEEEREQMLSKNGSSKTVPVITTTVGSSAPKLKDYLDSMRKDVSAVNNPMPPSSYGTPAAYVPDQTWPPAIRPTPLGSEMDNDPPALQKNNEQGKFINYNGSVTNQYSYSSNPTYALGQQSQQLQQLQELPKHHQQPQQMVQQHHIPQQQTQTNLYSYRQNVPYSPEQQSNFYAADQQSSSTYNNYIQHQTNKNQVEEDLSRRLSALNPNYNTVPVSTLSQIPYNYNQYNNYNTYTGTNYNYPGVTQDNTYTIGSYQPISSIVSNIDGTAMQNTAGSGGMNYSVAKESTDITNLSETVKPSQDVNNIQYSQYVPNVTVSNVYGGDVTSNCQIDTNMYSENANNILSYSTDLYGYNSFHGNSKEKTPYLDPSCNYSVQCDSQYQAANQSVEVSKSNNALYDYSNYYCQNVDDLAAYANNYYSYYGSYTTGNAHNYVNNSAQAHTSVTCMNNQPTPSTGQTTTVSSHEITENASNIDLLCGLDFSINEATLVPEQKTPVKIVDKEKQEIQCVKPEVQTTITKPITTKPLEELDIKKLPTKNLLGDPEISKCFIQEVEKFEKFVDGLTVKTLNGPTTLDIKWKEVQDKQDVDVQKKSISVARCYPLKNRFPDILPYDFSRVELTSTKDDYINASYIKNVNPYGPIFIATQSPISTSFVDFWTMVREQQVEIIICLLSDSELGNEIYWPKEKGKDLIISNMILSVQTVNNKSHCCERLISINLPEQRDSRTVMHLQFTSWPGSLFPVPSSFVTFVAECIALQQQQRSASHPLLVHCLSGVGRTGVFCSLMCAFMDISINPTCIPDLPGLVAKLSSARKNILRDREHLKYIYQAFLHYLKEIRLKFLSGKNTQENTNNEVSGKAISDTKSTEKEDPLSDLDPFWASKRGN